MQGHTTLRKLYLKDLSLMIAHTWNARTVMQQSTNMSMYEMKRKKGNWKKTFAARKMEQNVFKNNVLDVIQY